MSELLVNILMSMRNIAHSIIHCMCFFAYLMRFIYFATACLLIVITSNIVLANNTEIVFANAKNAQHDIAKERFICDGKEVIISDLKGKTILLHFWATWCPECEQNLGDLAEFVTRIEEDEEAPDIIVIPLSLDFQDSAMIQQYYAEHKIEKLKICTDEQWKLFKKLDLVSVPSSVILNPNGTEHSRHKGITKWNLYSAKTLLENSILNQK